MKDFTTKEYIKPIIDEIKRKYTPAKASKAALDCLHCIAILKRNGTRECIALRPGEPFFIWQHIETVKELYSTLQSWTEAAETEPGELDAWMYREEDRIQAAIRDALIYEIYN